MINYSLDTALKEKKTFFYTTLFPYLVCSLAALFYCYEFFIRVAPSAMTRDLMHAYNVNATAVGFLMAFYYYAYNPMQLPVGILMDRYGPRRLLSVAVVLCTLGTLLFATVVYYPAALLGQFLMGFGSSFGFVGVMKLAANWLPPKRFALVAGVATTLGMLGAMLGDSIATLLRWIGDWQSVWLYTSVVGFIIATLMWLIIRDEPYRLKKGRRIRKEYRHWRHMWIELKRIAANGQFWLNGLIGGLLYLPLTIFGASWGIMFLEQGYHLKSEPAGGIISMIFLGMAIGGPFVGWFSERVKRRKIFFQVGAFFSCIFSYIIVNIPNLTPANLSILFFLIGIFISAEILVFAVGHEITADKAAGTAVAGTNFLVMLGSGILPPIIGGLLDYNWEGGVVKGVHVFSLSDYRIALSVVPLSLFLAFMLSFFMKETYCKHKS